SGVETLVLGNFAGQSATLGALSQTAGLNTVDASALTSDVTLNAGARTTAITLTGGSGNDTLTGGSAADTLNGNAGNDSFTYDAADIAVTGGSGTDTLVVASATTLNLTSAVGRPALTGVDVIDLVTGSTVNTLTVDNTGTSFGVADGTAGTRLLRVDGDAGDTINAGAGWTDGGEVVIGATTYQQYVSTNAGTAGDTLQVNVAITNVNIVGTGQTFTLTGGADTFT